MNDFKIHNYDIKKYKFRELIEDLYQENNLEKLHKKRPDLLPLEPLNFQNEVSTKFHNLFYNKLRKGWNEFRDVYEMFIKEEMCKLIKEPFLYQYFPSFRVQIPNNKAVHKWHFDSDKDHKHPNGEINFCVAITKMKDTTAIWSETSPGKKDFFPMEANYGEFFNFNGNKCTHGNKVNTSENVRISFDFRILPKKKYNPTNSTLSINKKKKFVIGEYYSEMI